TAAPPRSPRERSAAGAAAGPRPPAPPRAARGRSCARPAPTAAARRPSPRGPAAARRHARSPAPGAPRARPAWRYSHVPAAALHPLHLVRIDGAHVVADVAHADLLEQRDDRLRIEVQLLRHFVNAHLAHRTSRDLHASPLVSDRRPPTTSAIILARAICFATASFDTTQTATSSRPNTGPNVAFSRHATARPSAIASAIAR